MIILTGTLLKVKVKYIMTPWWSHAKWDEWLLSYKLFLIEPSCNPAIGTNLSRFSTNAETEAHKGSIICIWPPQGQGCYKASLFDLGLVSLMILFLTALIINKSSIISDSTEEGHPVSFCCCCCFNLTDSVKSIDTLFLYLSSK